MKHQVTYSAKSAGGRLHIPYQYGFEWSDTVNWCRVVCVCLCVCVCVVCVPRWQQFQTDFHSHCSHSGQGTFYLLLCGVLVVWQAAIQGAPLPHWPDRHHLGRHTGWSVVLSTSPGQVWHYGRFLRTQVSPGVGWGAMSTFSPVGSWSANGMRMCVCMCVWTEWTWSMHYVGISTYQFIPYYASAVHKHTHPETIWGLWTDGAKRGYCWMGRFVFVFW